jgi:hypothetical protein
MIEASSMQRVDQEIRSSVATDRNVLEDMRKEVRPLKEATRIIHPRSATAISLVATDGGYNKFRFDPFMIQLIRVVDSSQNEHSLEIIARNTSLEHLNRKHLNDNGTGRTPLGRMMEFLQIRSLSELSPVFKTLDPSWVSVYREITEWAVLLSLVREKDFGTDTVILCDGLLRSKMFCGDLFGRYRRGLELAIKQQFDQHHRRIYVAGIAKRSNVLQTYRLALALEGVMRTTYPCYVEVPMNIEERVYQWDEYLKRDDKFVAGKMFLAKFGQGPYDPIWAVDLLLSQKADAASIFGFLLQDAKDGFPVPLYPQCLQKAHEHAALTDFDMRLLEDAILRAMRENLDDKRGILEELALQTADPARARYK